MRRISHSLLCVSAVTAAELLFGIKRFPLQDPAALAIRHFVSASYVPSWDVEAAEAYADIRHSLTTSAQLIGELDMMIAAHALALDAVLVTNNTAHFERIAPPLRIENWTQQ